MSGLKRFLFDEEAASATEYAILIGLLLMVLISGVTILSTNTNSAFNNCASRL
jgi:Flp pilus assembly pilin Flp